MEYTVVGREKSNDLEVYCKDSMPQNRLFKVHSKIDQDATFFGGDYVVATMDHSSEPSRKRIYNLSQNILFDERGNYRYVKAPEGTQVILTVDG